MEDDDINTYSDYEVGDASIINVNSDNYMVHGYSTETDLLVTRPLDSLYEFELKEIRKEILE